MASNMQPMMYRDVQQSWMPDFDSIVRGIANADPVEQRICWIFLEHLTTSSQPLEYRIAEGFRIAAAAITTATTGQLARGRELALFALSRFWHRDSNTSPSAQSSCSSQSTTALSTLTPTAHSDLPALLNTSTTSFCGSPCLALDQLLRNSVLADGNQSTTSITPTTLTTSICGNSPAEPAQANLSLRFVPSNPACDSQSVAPMASTATMATGNPSVIFSNPLLDSILYVTMDENNPQQTRIAYGDGHGRVRAVYEGSCSREFLPHGRGTFKSNFVTISGVFEDGYLIEGRTCHINGTIKEGLFLKGALVRGWISHSDGQRHSVP